MQETRRQPDQPAALCPVCSAPLRGQPSFCPACGTPLSSTTGRLQPDRLLAGRYRVVQLLARGGMGAVYLAEDTRLAGARVAVKEMSGAFTRGNTEAFARAVAEFEREAAILARLRHPHLPRVSDRFEEDGKHFLVMEYIQGQTLRAAIQQAGGRLPLAQALDYADQLCDVLAYLHSQQPPIVYRDLKPANVMVVSSIDDGATGRWGDGATDPVALSPHRPVTPSQIVLIDFGIARFYRPGLSADTAVYGTIGYAPPEQYGKGQTDVRTDIYALGVLLHQMLTGHEPTTTPFALPPPRTLDPSIPPHLAAAIERATANDRANRFPDSAAFRVALRTPAAATLPPVVQRAPPPIARTAIAAPAQPQRAGGPRFLIWALGAVAVLLIAALLIAMLPRLVRTGLPRPSAPTLVAATAARPAPTTARPAPTAARPAPTVESVANAPTAATAASPDGPAPALITLRPVAVSASRTSAPGVDGQGNQVTYEPAKVADGKNDTAWRADGNGAGQWLLLDFASPVTVAKIGIIPGYDKIDQYDGTDRFAQNRVVKRVRLEFSDGTTQEAGFAQRRDMQFVEPPAPVRTSSLRIVILETYPPPPDPIGRDFTPISEVVVQGSLAG